MIADLVLDSQTITFALSVGAVVFSVGMFVATTRGLTRRLGDLEKTVHEHGLSLHKLDVDLAKAKLRRNGDSHRRDGDE